MRFCLEVILRGAVLASVVAAAAPAENANPEIGKAVTPKVVSVVRPDARTGRLVRSVVVSPKPAAVKDPDPAVQGMIDATAKSLDVNPSLVHSVIEVESNYNPYAVSPKGAQGLMQLMPDTAKRFGVQNTFDAQQNIEGGIRYLKFLQQTFGDDRLAIAAYNAGEKAVQKYGSVPPYPETKDYVQKVAKKYDARRAAGKKIQPAPVAEKPQPAEEEPRHIMGYLDEEGRLHIASRP